MVNPPEGVPRIPFSSPSTFDLATLSDTSNDPCDDVVSVVTPYRTGSSLAHRIASVKFDVPKDELEKLCHVVSCIRKTLGKTQSALKATQARLQVVELGPAQREAQLDILFRIRQLMAMPNVAAQAPLSSRATDPEKA